MASFKSSTLKPLSYPQNITMGYKGILPKTLEFSNTRPKGDKL